MVTASDLVRYLLLVLVAAIPGNPVFIGGALIYIIVDYAYLRYKTTRVLRPILSYYRSHQKEELDEAVLEQLKPFSDEASVKSVRMDWNELVEVEVEVPLKDFNNSLKRSILHRIESIDGLINVRFVLEGWTPEM